MKKMLGLLFAVFALTVVSADVEVEETEVAAAVVAEEEVLVSAPVVDAEVVAEVVALG